MTESVCATLSNRKDGKQPGKDRGSIISHSTGVVDCTYFVFSELLGFPTLQWTHCRNVYACNGNK
jgi:hypothetical protein